MRLPVGAEMVLTGVHSDREIGIMVIGSDPRTVKSDLRGDAAPDAIYRSDILNYVNQSLARIRLRHCMLGVIVLVCRSSRHSGHRRLQQRRPRTDPEQMLLRQKGPRQEWRASLSSELQISDLQISLKDSRARRASGVKPRLNRQTTTYCFTSSLATTPSLM
jgi:hypothetical protein